MRSTLVAAGLCAGLCAAVPTDSADPTVDPPALVVEASGCDAVGWGPVCEVGAAAVLTVWARTAPGARLAVTVGGATASDAGVASQGGWQWRLPIPPGSDAVRVVARRGSRHAAWTMALRPSTRAPALERAEGLRKTSPAEAEAIAATLVDAPDLRSRAAARGILARIRLADRDIEEAMKGLKDAATLHRAAGWPSEALRDDLALAFAATTVARDFRAAREALRDAETLLGAVPDGEARVRYYAGLLGLETGDYRAASWALRQAILAAERVRSDPHVGSAASALASLEQLLGREDEGVRLLEQAERLTAELSDVCTRALIWDIAGWFRLNARVDAGSARDALEKALALQRQGCGWPGLAAQILTDLAVLATREGTPDKALALLAEARAAQPQADPKTRAWWLDVEGQIALTQGNAAAALHTYERLSELAAAAGLPEAELRAALGRARALEALGRSEVGSAYDDAEHLLERRALLVPAHEGRLGFFSTFDDIARSAVACFLEGDPARAAAFARRALVRNLALLRWADRVASLSSDERARWDAAVAAYGRGRKALEDEAQADWKLSEDDLARAASARKARGDALLRALDEAIAGLRGSAERPGEVALQPPSEGELLLVVHEVPTGLAVFGVTRGGARAVRLGPASGGASLAARAAEMLERFHAEIRGATQIRVEAPSSFDAVDFHALPFDGAPLLASVRVVYGFFGGGAPAREGAAGSLVVGDPRGDLAAARREAAAVEASLEGARLRVEALVGPAATHAAVDDRLRRGDLSLFHYAGHGFFGGESAWGAGLPLAAGSVLSAGDILTLPRAPEVVVLSGCETARAEPSQSDAGLGLAHAFLVAGSRVVVASPRNVRDRAAAAFSGALYASTGEDWIERSRRASLAVRAQLPTEDWAAFRTLVR